MGDRLATRHGSKIGGCAPFGSGELGPHATQSGLGRGLPSYQVTSSSVQPFGHNRHKPKFKRGAVSLGVELGPHLIQCCHSRGRPSYQVASWSIQPFSHNKHEPKIGRLCPPLFYWGELGPHLAQCGLGQGIKYHVDPCSCLTTIDMERNPLLGTG